MGWAHPAKRERLTIALPRGSEAVARLAVTAVAASSVDAFGIALAHWTVLTLINIYKQKITLLEENRIWCQVEEASHIK